LIFAAVVSAVGLYSQMEHRSWLETTGEMVSLHAVRKTAHDLRAHPVSISYRYRVAGRTYNAHWTGYWAEAGTLVALSPKLREQAHTLGYCPWNELPPGLFAYLWDADFWDFGELERRLGKSVGERGEVNVQNMPDQARKVLEREGYTTIVDIPSDGRARYAAVVTPFLGSAYNDTAVSASEPLIVLYDPANPQRSELITPGSKIYPWKWIFGGSFLTAMAYLGVAYPYWKRRL